jgi:3-methyladenine DNA glycosylase AlkD
MELQDIIERLKAMGSPERCGAMKRAGIRGNNIFGISVEKLRQLAEEIGTDHYLANQLWALDIHEAKLLASIIDDPKEVTPEQMDQWIRACDSWDICDGLCGNLFDRTPFTYQKALEWSQRSEEFMKRGGFVLMARLALKSQKTKNEQFEAFWPLIIHGADDDRNFVKKAVNWALRQIGKRNLVLNTKCITIAKDLCQSKTKSAIWIGKDALKELQSDPIQKRIGKNK